MTAYGSCAPVGRIWTGTKPLPTPSPRPPRPSTISDPRRNHERASGGAATALIIVTCGLAGYAVAGVDRAPVSRAAPPDLTAVTRRRSAPCLLATETGTGRIRTFS